jgi:hypothetical protein
MIRRFLLLIPPILALACSTNVPDPSASSLHPANPEAVEAPPPTRSTVLAIGDTAATKPSDKAGGQR